MYISTSLHDVILQNQNGIGYPFGDPIFGGFGQIERVSVPTHGTTVYVAVTSGGSATSLKVSYVTKFVKEAIKRSVGDSLQAAVQHSLPWHVQLRYTLNDGSSRHFCSAALISKEWVVTAARCFPNGIKDKLKSGSKFLIRLGGHNIDEHDLQLLPFGEEDMFIHKDYNPVTRENDIALIHLREDASISLAIQTIQLPSGESSITIKGGLAATLSGWGSNNPTGELLEATVSMKTIGFWFL
ncbi:chymotrypsin BI-like [Corticium candelabrum]|uniref:chymotrypsin BI-like n=1 Tax=Corticium candelabrum TaxID=121492 RepID=UPI002E264875|nr:chymotrypsin BI-like [Corticium candelabrum]